MAVFSPLRRTHFRFYNLGREIGARRPRLACLSCTVVAALIAFTALVQAQTAEQVAAAQSRIQQLCISAARLQAKWDYDGAITQLTEALELSEKNFGPDDPFTGMSLNYLGQNYTLKGNY